MAIVIHTIKGNDYAYEHHRVGAKVVCDYLGKLGGKGGTNERTQLYHQQPEVIQQTEIKYNTYRGVDDPRINEYIKQPTEEEKERLFGEYDERLKTNKAQYKELLHYDEQVKKGITSKSENSTNGEYNPRRQELHNNIVNELTENKTPQPKPIAVFFGGATASGKSRLMDYVKDKGKNFVYINNDEIKKKLPEYKGTAAGYVHDESRDVTDAVQRKAISNRYNLILDSTLRNPEKTRISFEEAKKRGYEVVLLSNVVPLEISLNRAANRFLNPSEEGRYVPIDRIIREHDKTNKSQFELIKYADRGQIFDSNVEKSEPLKVIINKR